MLASKLTQKCQATIPAKVRKVLGIKAGDVIAFKVEDGKVVIRKIGCLSVEDQNRVNAALVQLHGSPAPN